MEAFIDGYDAAFFDLDGVLYLGPYAVPGAVEGVRALHERGVRTVYVTNNAARSTAVVAQHLRDLGFEAADDEVVSSAQAAMTRTDGVAMNSERCSASAPPNIQATTPATIQVTSDRASSTKPRFPLIRLEITMTAIIAQSNQVSTTVQTTNGKGATF